MVTDLINDWSVKTIPDLYHFVPYTWTVNLQIKEFELVLLTNEYNWIDTSSHQPENGRSLETPIHMFSAINNLIYHMFAFICGRYHPWDRFLMYQWNNVAIDYNKMLLKS